MEEINIEENNGNIVHSVKTTHNENSLIDNYRREVIALNVTESKLKQLPNIITGLEMNISYYNKMLEINEGKQERIIKVFGDLDLNIKDEINKIKEKYSEKERLEHAENIVSKTKSSIVKKGLDLVFSTEVVQTREDALFELMILGEEKVNILEKLMRENETLAARHRSEAELGESLKGIQERITTIKMFFAKRHQNIDKLLDKRAQSRNKNKTAEALK